MGGRGVAAVREVARTGRTVRARGQQGHEAGKGVSQGEAVTGTKAPERGGCPECSGNGPSGGSERKSSGRRGQRMKGRACRASEDAQSWLPL